MKGANEVFEAGVLLHSHLIIGYIGAQAALGRSKDRLMVILVGDSQCLNKLLKQFSITTTINGFNHEKDCNNSMYDVSDSIGFCDRSRWG